MKYLIPLFLLLTSCTVEDINPSACVDSSGWWISAHADGMYDMYNLNDGAQSVDLSHPVAYRWHQRCTDGREFYWDTGYPFKKMHQLPGEVWVEVYCLSTATDTNGELIDVIYFVAGS